MQQTNDLPETNKQLIGNLEKIFKFQINLDKGIEQSYSCIFYFNFTNNKQIRIFLDENIEKMIISDWNEGFLGKLKEQEKYLIYFEGFINDDIFDLNSLSKIKLFIKNFVKKYQFEEIEFVMQFVDLQKNEEIENYKVKIKDYIQSIIDGLLQPYSFPNRTEKRMSSSLFKESDTINMLFFLCLFTSLDDNTVKGHFCNQWKTNFNNQEFQLQNIDSLLIKNLYHYRSIINGKRNDCFNEIGFQCVKYIEEEVKIIYESFNKQLESFLSDIQKLLELPINLNDEIREDKNIEQFYTKINNFLIQLTAKQITCQIEEQNLFRLAKDIITISQEYTTTILGNLEQIQKNEVRSYLNSRNKQILNFQFQFNQNDNKILTYFKEYSQNNALLVQQLKLIEKQCHQWIESNEEYIPQRLAYISRFVNNSPRTNQQNDYISFCVLGLTRVGKSTLLNLLHNPNNLIVELTDQNTYVFNAVNTELTISNKCISETIEVKEIQNEDFKFTFIDTPGFGDTKGIDQQLINQINIFSRIKEQKFIMILFLIDGNQLCNCKKDLQESIQHTNYFFHNQLDAKTLKQILIPVFTKVNQNIMQSIKNKWDSEIMINCNNNNYEIEFLKIIKQKVDANQYVEILEAKFYQNNSLQQLEMEQRSITKQITDAAIKKNYSILDELGVKSTELEKMIIDLQNNKEKIQYFADIDKITELKEQIIQKCVDITQNINQQQVQLNFKLKLGPEMQNTLQSVLKQINKINSFVDFLASNIIINNLINEHRSLEEIKELILKITQNLSELNKGNLNELEFIKIIFKQLNLEIKQPINDLLDQLRAIQILEEISEQNLNKKESIDFEILKKIIKKLENACEEIENWIKDTNKNKEKYRLLLWGGSGALITAAEIGACALISAPLLAVVGPLIIFGGIYRSKAKTKKQEKNEKQQYQDYILKMLREVFEKEQQK
ncbi:unnamed protein product [Paramecium sonneborni]|uniref:G domain-containing protein n=1 Tax=Paramecium sonneborni TaxID=65129 RepID=A0A8S1RD20_9CILI|nr:unnamed protein product [Paramecium sonneborni]